MPSSSIAIWTGTQKAGLACITNLNERFALLQACSGFWKALAQDVLQPCIRGITTRHPQNLGWWTKPLQEQDKITILTHDYCARLPRRVKDG